jgi:hypothetical protein
MSIRPLTSANGYRSPQHCQRSVNVADRKRLKGLAGTSDAHLRMIQAGNPKNGATIVRQENRADVVGCARPVARINEVHGSAAQCGKIIGTRP